MKNILLSLLCLVVLFTGVLPVQAAQLKVFVKDINAVGAQNKDEMKTTLQTLLASRLNNKEFTSVGSAAEADLQISGTYIAIGKIFSLDALAKNNSGTIVARSFVQGESQDELIPAVGTLATKLMAEIGSTSNNYATVVTSVASSSNGILTATPRTDFIKNEQIQPAQSGDFIKSQGSGSTDNGGWLSKRLEGAATLLALGSSLPDGSRELFLAEDKRIIYYRKGNELKQVASIELGNSEKIISLDALTIDSKTELYVTIIRSSDLQSKIFQIQGEKLIQIAENQPYYFRVMALAGGSQKLYVQGMGRDDDFYGDVQEAKRSGSKLELLKTVIKMPRFANIYNFNQFKSKDGKTFTVALNPDNYILVYDEDNKEIWRSNDKFGGSELYFQREGADPRVTGDIYRWIFMNQRIAVTANNEILVGKNGGFWVLGNARSYKNGAVYNFYWNGSSLEEKWRTKDTQNYMPDFAIDEARNELIILQTVHRPGLTQQGASSINIKKIQ